jgi:hypothetical protein
LTYLDFRPGDFVILRTLYDGIMHIHNLLVIANYRSSQDGLPHIVSLSTANLEPPRLVNWDDDLDTSLQSNDSVFRNGEEIF